MFHPQLRRNSHQQNSKTAQSNFIIFTLPKSSRQRDRLHTKITNQKIRKIKIPTENFSWQISVKIAGIAELKMQLNIPKSQN
ncbi:MAG TPA: hypothetical protein V6C71_08840 [Coleofasciculaceae cyanobacterium]